MTTRSIARSLRASVLFLSAVLCLVAPASAQTTNPQKLVTDAQTTLNNFMRDPAQTWIHDNIGRAKALLIVPQIVKAGFIFGGSGGQGVLVVRSGTTWVGPAFYDLATASVGFQAGVEVSEAVIVAMTDKGHPDPQDLQERESYALVDGRGQGCAEMTALTIVTVPR